MTNTFFVLVAITTISILISSLLTETSSLKFHAAGEEIYIPAWEKDVAKWWANDEIGDSDFAQGIQYLLTERLMKIPETKVGSISSAIIPSWIKTDAKWWAKGTLGDSTFIQGIQYLIRSGVITLPETTQNQPVPLRVNPIVWFAPEPQALGFQFVGAVNFNASLGGQLEGSSDFMDLFKENAPWQNATRHVQVFKLYSEWVRTAPFSELNQTVAYLNNHGIAIAIEQGALEKTPTCGQGVEGFSGKEPTLDALYSIKEAGGTVRFIALDGPFFHGSLYNGPNACHFSALKVAESVTSYVQFVKQNYPDIVIGDIEPIGGIAGISQDENWLNIYSAVSGSNFPFLQFDTDFNTPNWPAVDKALESFCHARGIQVGMIYHGFTGATSDADWYAVAQKEMINYEIKEGGRPDSVIFQSWQPHPYYVLPETSSSSFTHLILSYFKTRTTFSISTSQSSGSSLVIDGNLTQADGKPLTQVPVQLFTAPATQPGAFTESDGSSLGSTTTDINGNFHFNLTEITSGTILEAKYSGDENNWPAYTEIKIH